MFCEHTVAQLLKKAADVALKQVKIDENADRVETGWINPTYKYFAGITIENLLKGIIIAEHPTLVGEERMLRSPANYEPWTRQADKLKLIKSLLTKDEKIS